jgi:hypothetical protein
MSNAWYDLFVEQSGNPRQLSLSPDRPVSASSPAALNRSLSTTPAQSSLSSPVCMEPATTYFGASTADSQLDAGGEQAHMNGWRGGESDHRMMAYSSAAMRPSMDADLALAIALQVFYLQLKCDWLPKSLKNKRLAWFVFCAYNSCLILCAASNVYAVFRSGTRVIHF